MSDKNTIEMIEKKVDSLPLIDSAVAEIVTLLNNPDSNFEQIVERLSPDLSTRFLKIANSAYYSREVRSISFAVKLLGYSKMKDILITSILMDHFTKRIMDFRFDKFLEQAQFCAAVAMILGEILDFHSPDDLFTVATLQNIGKLVIAVYFKDEHKKIITLKKSKGLTTSEAEKEILGISHGEIGAIVLKRFNIPQDICDAVKFHDSSEESLPDSTDPHLSYIARQAAAIVGNFALPEGKNPLKLTHLLKATVEKGKCNCRQQVRKKIRSKGYGEIFPELLEQAANLVAGDLKRYLNERNSQ